MSFRIMNGRKLVEMTTSTLLKRMSPCSSAAMNKSLQLRYGSGGHGGDQLRTFEEGETRPWNYLWQPAPYPETKEEREAAARKYVSTAYAYAVTKGHVLRDTFDIIYQYFFTKKSSISVHPDFALHLGWLYIRTLKARNALYNCISDRA